MSVVFLSGTLALITSFIGLLPQVFKALKTKSTQDISMLMLLNYTLCSFAWVIYGSNTDSFFVTCSNVIGLLVSLALIFLKRYYDTRS